MFALLSYKPRRPVRRVNRWLGWWCALEPALFSAPKGLPGIRRLSVSGRVICE